MILACDLNTLNDCRQGKRNPAEVGVRHPQSVWFGIRRIRRIRHAKQEKRSISDAKAQRLKYVPHPSFVESNWFEATHHPIISHPCVTSTHSQQANRLTLTPAVGVVGTLSWSAWTSLSQALGLMEILLSHLIDWCGRSKNPVDTMVGLLLRGSTHCSLMSCWHGLDSWTVGCGKRMQVMVLGRIYFEVYQKWRLFSRCVCLYCSYPILTHDKR